MVRFFVILLAALAGVALATALNVASGQQRAAADCGPIYMCRIPQCWVERWDWETERWVRHFFRKSDMLQPPCDLPTFPHFNHNRGRGSEHTSAGWRRMNQPGGSAMPPLVVLVGR